MNHHTEEPQARPGIFYENLALSQEIYEAEHKPSSPGLLEGLPKLPILGGLLLLIFLLVPVVIWGRSCDPDANAMTGLGIALSNREYAIYYWTEYQTCLSQLQEQEAQAPFDQSRPLDRQYYDLETGETWESFFLRQAMDTAALTQSLCQEARQTGFVLSETQQQEFAQQLAAVEQGAAAAGFLTQEGQGDLTAYAAHRYGPETTERELRQYLFDRYLAQAYGAWLYQASVITPDALEAYAAQHTGEDAALTPTDLPNVDVRHILLIPEEDSRDTAQDQAQALLAQCHTQQDFARMAALYSQDAGSRRQGGLYENVYPGQMVSAFDSWCFDPSGHEPGDMGIVETEYGIHLMYFVGYRNNYHWADVAEAGLRTELLEASYAALLQKYHCRLTNLAAVPEP